MKMPKQSASEPRKVYCYQVDTRSGRYQAVATSCMNAGIAVRDSGVRSDIIKIEEQYEVVVSNEISGR